MPGFPAVAPMIAPPNIETILVVDDCEPVCEIIELLLGPVGYRVLRASNGEEALLLAHGDLTIDLLMAASDLLEMPFAELAGCFAAIHPAAAVILLSNGHDPIATPAPFERLTKPFTVAELRDTVRRALGARRIVAEASYAA